MKKNVAGQTIGAQMVSATDGSAFTGAVTVYVTGDAGTQAAGSVGSGACTHEGNGYHTYAPSQAETNYDLIAFTFVGSGAVPATVQVFTGYPQTGDGYAAIGALNDLSAADVLAAAYEGSETLQQFLRLARAVLVGKSSGGGAVYRDAADSKPRVTATLDTNGNRTAVTVDAT